MSVRLVPFCIALLVVVVCVMATPVSALPHIELLEALLRRLSIGSIGSIASSGASSGSIDVPSSGDVLRARLVLGAVMLAAAWAVTRAMGLGPGGSGSVAGGFAACLLVGSPAWLGAGPGAVLATGAALIAVAAARRLAVSGAPHDAVAAAVAVAAATAFEPGYAGLSLPLVALWWLRVGRRSALVRSARSPVGQLRLASTAVAPLVALLALGAALLGGGRAPLLWPGWQAGGAPLLATSVAGVLRALAELLGPTAAVAALAGGVALVAPPRRAAVEGAAGPMSAMSPMSATASGAVAAPGAPSPSGPTSLVSGAGQPADAGRAGAWTLALLLMMLLGGALCDLRRHALGVPAVTAAALAAGFAIQRLAAMAVVTLPASGGGEAEAAGAPAPAVTFASGAIFVALTAGFLVLAPSLLPLLLS